VTQPVRVLHVVGRMHRGGVETWLMHVLRNTNRARYAFDFLVQTSEPADYDQEILSSGSRILRCERPQSPSYPLRLLRTFAQFGPYDVVHSHVHHFSGLILTIAAFAGVPIRIAHCHNSRLSAPLTLLRRIYLNVSKRLIRRFATSGLAVSNLAADSLFGRRWHEEPRWSVQHLGVDLSRFRQTVDPQHIRRDMGIPADAFVIAHIGRFDPQKNHAFLLDIAAAAMTARPNVWLLLIGEGRLKAETERKVRDLGIARQVVFAGARGDVPCILRSVDAFAMPSLYEGLPLAAVEAQAAGLPVVLSDTITPEVIISAEQCQMLSLSQSPTEWASAVFRGRGQQADAALAAVNKSSFGLDRTLDALCAEYNRGREV
jgi:glycosyltransferase involved in cell wall biosynthesis